MEESISNARIIDESDINTDKVSILSKVKIENLNLKKEFQYIIVSEEESNLQKGKISIKSPIGMGLLGKKKGEIVSIMKIFFLIINVIIMDYKTATFGSGCFWCTEAIYELVEGVIDVE